MKKIIIAFAFIIFVISIGVFSYLYLFPSAIITLPATEAIPVTDLNKVLQEEFTQEIASEVGYTIKFPKDFVVRKSSSVLGQLHAYNYDPSSVRSVEGFNEDQMKVSIYIYDNPASLNVKDWYLDARSNVEKIDPGMMSTINSLSNFNFQSKEGIRLNTTDFMGNISEGILMPLNGKILEIGVMPVNNKSLAIFNKALDSLQLK